MSMKQLPLESSNLLRSFKDTRYLLLILLFRGGITITPEAISFTAERPRNRLGASAKHRTGLLIQPICKISMLQSD